MSVREFRTSHRRDEQEQGSRGAGGHKNIPPSSAACEARGTRLRVGPYARLLLCFVFCVSAVNLFLFPSQAAFNQKAGEQAAPEFSLKDLKGKQARLGDYKGKVVLVNFWATWCAPCKAEMPELVKWQKEYKDRGLQIIGITFQPYRTADVRVAARRLKINYPILLDTGEAAELYGPIDVLPLTIVIDGDGNIRDRIRGIIDREEFEQKIKPLLQTTSKAAR